MLSGRNVHLYLLRICSRQGDDANMSQTLITEAYCYTVKLIGNEAHFTLTITLFFYLANACRLNHITTNLISRSNIVL